MFNGFKKQVKTTFAMPPKPKALDSVHIKAAIKKIKNITTADAIATTEVLEHILELEEETVPQCYIDLLYEVSKNTPIFGLMQSSSRIFLSSIKSYLDSKFNIFEDKEVLDHLNNEIPVVIAQLQSVRKYESTSFLPPPVVSLFNHVILTYENAMKLASQRYIKPANFSHTEPPLEYFPSLPLHSNQSNFDNDVGESTEEDCNKDYPKAPKMTPGIAHSFCRHKICKGFVCMSNAESQQIFIKILLRRLEKKVMTERRVFLYDNSCNLHKTALNRGAKDILKFKVLTDRHHWKNHTGCSESYNCDEYDFLKNVNSQICEQKNRSLRKLSSTLAYCDFNNYKTKIKLFCIVNNMEEKNMI